MSSFYFCFNQNELRQTYCESRAQGREQSFSLGYNFSGFTLAKHVLLKNALGCIVTGVMKTFDCDFYNLLFIRHKQIDLLLGN